MHMPMLIPFGVNALGDAGETAVNSFDRAACRASFETGQHRQGEHDGDRGEVKRIGVELVHYEPPARWDVAFSNACASRRFAYESRCCAGAAERNVNAPDTT